jgi:hypothetical protein
MMKFRNSQWRGWALFWSLFIGIGAIAGGCGMLADISGQTLRLDTFLPMMQVLPFSDYLFQDFLFSGVALIVLIGATNLLAFFLFSLEETSESPSVSSAGSSLWCGQAFNFLFSH